MQPALLVGVRYLSRSLNKPDGGKLLSRDVLLSGQPLQFGPDLTRHTERHAEIGARFAPSPLALAAPTAAT